MAPETAVVISASVSGLVAIASVGISALREAAADRRRTDREAQHRAEDRAWAVRLHNLQERREHYREVLAILTQVHSDLSRTYAKGRLRQAGGAPQGEVHTTENDRRRLREGLAKLVDVATIGQTVAYDQSVLDLLDEFRQTAVGALGAVSFTQPESAGLLHSLDLLRQQLVVAFRQDLALDVAVDR